jgi:hypothetical protein
VRRLWNAHYDERGFAATHIFHVASGTPVATILRPTRTPKGTEVRCDSGAGFYQSQLKIGRRGFGF